MTYSPEDNKHKFTENKILEKKGVNLLWDQYGGSKKLFKGWPFKISVFVTIVFSFILLYQDNYLKILWGIIDLGVGVLPILLGFNLGGYALIISFGNTSLLKDLSSRVREEGTTDYLKISAIFGWGLFSQSATFLSFSLIKILDLYTINLSVLLSSQAINFLIVSVIVFSIISFIYSVILVPQMVINVFTFSKIHQSFIFKDINKKVKTKIINSQSNDELENMIEDYLNKSGLTDQLIDIKYDSYVDSENNVQYSAFLIFKGN